jgi:hypothetical protein
VDALVSYPEGVNRRVKLDFGIKNNGPEKPARCLSSTNQFISSLFVGQTLVDADPCSSAGGKPTGDDRKYDHNSQPDPDAVCGGVIYSGEVDDFSQSPDKRRSDAQTDGQRQEPTGESQHQALPGENETDVS